MKYHQLQARAQHPATRVGRGISAGKGKTAGRGTKGQGARKSGGVRPGFEGGQMPLYMRLPKLKGFKSKRPKTELIYTGQLNTLPAAVDNFSLAAAGLISSPYASVKLITKGELKAKKSVRLQAASRSAVNALESAGGSFQPIPKPRRQPVETAGRQS